MKITNIEDLQDIIIRKLPENNEVLIVGISRNPNLFSMTVNLKKEVKSAKDGLVSKLWGLFKQESKDFDKEERKRAYISLKPEKKLHVDYENIKQVKLDKKGTLALMSEEKGRVLLADLNHMIIVKMWKGIRECWMTFHSAENMQYGILFSMVRGLLECYLMRHGCKVYSKYIGNKLKLFDLPRPMILTNENKLYTIELENNYAKTSNDEEYIKKIYMEQYMLQGLDAKEQSILSEIYDNLNSPDITEEFIISKISQISSNSLLNALYEKVFEVLPPKSEIAYFIIRETVKKLRDQFSLQNGGSGEKYEAQKSLEKMEEKLHLLNIYVDIKNAKSTNIDQSNLPEDLYKWFIFYDHILQLQKDNLLNKNYNLIEEISWNEFINKIQNKEYDQKIGNSIMSTLKISEKLLFNTLAKLSNRIPSDILFDFFTNWLDSLCSCKNCFYRDCELWKICKEINNPIENYLKQIFMTENENNGIYLEKIKNYLMKSTNFTHMVIICNIMKQIIKNSDVDFELFELCSKFHLLIVSNIQIQDISIKPFSFDLKTSIFEYISRNQILVGEKSHLQIEMCDLDALNMLKNDTLEFSLNLQDKYKNFGDYFKQLNIDTSRFYDNLSQSKLAGSAGVNEDIFKSYKKPYYLLTKLTNNFEFVKFLITIGRIWNYAIKLNIEGSIDDLNAINTEFTYIKNQALRLSVFIKVWRKIFANEIISFLQPKSKEKIDKSKQILDRISNILKLYKEDLKFVKSQIKLFIVKNSIKTDQKFTDQEILDKIMTEQFLLGNLKKVFNLEHMKSHNCNKKCETEFAFLHNMLYDPQGNEIIDLLENEILKYYKHCKDSKFEKEFMLPIIENNEEIKNPSSESPQSIKIKDVRIENDIFYKQDIKLIEILIRILQGELRIRETKKSKVAQKKEKTAKKYSIYEIIGVKDKILVDSIWIKGDIQKQTYDLIKMPNAVTQNARFSYFNKLLRVDPEKCIEIAKYFEYCLDENLSHHIKNLIIEGKDKQFDKFFTYVFFSHYYY